MMAESTSRVTIGPGATSPFLDHPVRIASEISTLQQISNGRASLGLGRGSLFELISVEPPRGPEPMAEAAQVVRYLTSGGTGGFQGKHFSVAPSFGLRWLGDTPRPKLWAGTSAQRTMQAMAPHVDAVSVAGLWQPRQAALFRGWLDQAGCSNVELGASVWTVLDENRERGLELARRHVALRIPATPRFALDAGMAREELNAVTSALQNSGLEAAAAAVSAEGAGCFCAIGGVEDLIAGVRRLNDAGVGMISFGGPFGPDIEAVLTTIGEKVLPHVRNLTR
ncbi:MAG: LLM class flavin-dependent oxidoreductase, partial [Chloroflexi bacterium]|nr:LLM class flavin-dependent oxidoreductase [Chloroflexota bacterium]